MKHKNTIAGISALALICTNCLPALAASAAEETPDYKASTMNVHIYSEDKSAEIDCRYYNDLPSIPYVKLSDYYKLWLDQELAITNEGDGVYEVKVPAGIKGTVNVNEETIKTDDSAYFFTPQDEVEGTSDSSNIFIREQDIEHEAVEAEIDFSEYDIDLKGDEDELWFPVVTLCDIYESGDKMSMYFEEELYFCGDLLSDYSKMMALEPEHVAYFADKYKDGRPEDLVKYNYNELCLSVDLKYGFPGRIAYNDLLAEKGFDGMLSEANDTTKAIKELLLSDDVYKYCAGLQMLNNYMWDGGHTAFVALLTGNEETAALVGENMLPPEEMENAFDYQSDMIYSIMSADAATKARAAMIETAESVQENETSLYFVNGDTAVFSFDDFICDYDGWEDYYNKNAEMPEDLVKEFFDCVMKANDDPAVKNLVIDVGSNGGGYVAIALYMMGLLNDVDSLNVRTSQQSSVENMKYTTDKNLDKTIDENDEAIKIDLNIGMITSKYSFSCGNLLPAMANDEGYMLLGDRSGGGSCAVVLYLTPDGSPYQLSSGLTLLDKNGESIDKGIAPSYDLTKVDDEGVIDFSDVYNWDNIRDCFGKFYPDKYTAPEVTTTTADASATTTTTSAQESTTSTSNTETASGSSGSTTTTTAVPTTGSDGNTELPQTGNNSMAAASAVMGSVLMILSGTYIVKKNGRKEN